jgi:hypothetical protein
MDAYAMQLMQAHHQLEIATRGPGFTDVTRRAVDWLQQIGVRDGLLTLSSGIRPRHWSSRRMPIRMCGTISWMLFRPSHRKIGNGVTRSKAPTICRLTSKRW